MCPCWAVFNPLLHRRLFVLSTCIWLVLARCAYLGVPLMDIDNVDHEGGVPVLPVQDGVPHHHLEVPCLTTSSTVSCSHNILVTDKCCPTPLGQNTGPKQQGSLPTQQNTIINNKITEVTCQGYSPTWASYPPTIFIAPRVFGTPQAEWGNI